MSDGARDPSTSLSWPQLLCGKTTVRRGSKSARSNCVPSSKRMASRGGLRCSKSPGLENERRHNLMRYNLNINVMMTMMIVCEASLAPCKRTKVSSKQNKNGRQDYGLGW